MLRYNTRAVERLRKAAGMSLNDLHVQVVLAGGRRTQQSTCRWCAGHIPRADDLAILAAALGVDISDFFKEKVKLDYRDISWREEISE